MLLLLLLSDKGQTGVKGPRVDLLASHHYVLCGGKGDYGEQSVRRCRIAVGIVCGQGVLAEDRVTTWGAGCIGNGGRGRVCMINAIMVGILSGHYQGLAGIIIERVRHELRKLGCCCGDDGGREGELADMKEGKGSVWVRGR
jgi:hypothetical protein